ncbi:MAG: sugar ABC transporter ATP-binding protein [bacterium]
MLLQVREVSKIFPGMKALDRVDFTLRQGEIHTIMGENGAGKSTLIKIITGVYRRDGGQILLEGRPIDPRTPPEAQRLGISAVHQEVNLVPYLSVAENIFLGRQPIRFGRIDWRKICQMATDELGRLDVAIDVTQPLGSYSIAIQQLAAIARALLVRSKVLILDEPTSSLSEQEVEKLFTIMRKLASEGIGIIFITHFLDQAYAVADRFTVLRNGRFVGEYETSSMPRFELVAKMIGKDAAEVAEIDTKRRAKPAQGEQKTILHTSGLARKGLKPLDIEIRTGEVLGFAGLLGSGRSEIARMLFGIDLAEGGVVEIDGKPVRLDSPRKAINNGLGFCPEDRRTSGIIPDLSVRENIVLALQASRGWLRRIPRKKQQDLVEKYIRTMNIATPDAEKRVAVLSGGSQQKVILARWLASAPRLLILDEPTRGVDVGARAEIEKLMASLCAEGMAILFISSELEEVVRDSHRVAVIKDGAKIGELTGAQLELSAIMRMIAARKEDHEGA